MPRNSWSVTVEAELRTKALELALHEAFQGIAPQDTAAIVQRAEVFFAFLMPGTVVKEDEGL
jgi:hypothetical protein